MIDLDLLEQMLREAAYVVPFVSEDDLAGAVTNHSRAFARVEPADLQRAYQAWADEQSEDSPPRTLPYVGTIRRILDGAPEVATSGSSEPGWADEWPEVDPHFMRQHRLFQKWAEALPMRHAAPHSDHPPDVVDVVDDDCAGCRFEAERAEMRELIGDKLELLPEAPDRRTAACMCLGSKMVYEGPRGAFIGLPPADRRVDDEMPRSVPCPMCNRAGHDEWLGYSEATGSRKAS